MPVAGIPAHISGNDTLSGCRGFADQSLSESDFQRKGGPLPAFADDAGTGTEAKAVGSRLQCEYPHVVIVEGFLDELGDAARQFVSVEHARDLGTDLAYQVELAEAKPFHLHPMGGVEAYRHNTSNASQELKLLLREIGPARTCNLKNAQKESLIFDRHGSQGLPGARLEIGALDEELAARKRAAHSLRAGLRGEDAVFLPIGQAEEVLMQPHFYVAAHHAGRHGNNSIMLRCKRRSVGQLFPQARDLTPT